ncbi:MAG: DUF4229 domain-containing protein [Canibacter sp.]
MSAKQAWIWYTVLRILFFAVPFALLLWLLPGDFTQGITWTVLFAAVCAALISLSLSVLLLSKLRDRAAMSFQQWRQKDRTSDDEFEDDAIDHA